MCRPFRPTSIPMAFCESSTVRTCSIRRGHAQTPLYDQGRGHARYVAHHSAFCHSNRCQRKGVCGDPAESGGLWIIPGLTDGGGKQPNSYCKHCASGGAEDKGG